MYQFLLYSVSFFIIILPNYGMLLYSAISAAKDVAELRNKKQKLLATNLILFYFGIRPLL
jgi:hypothetical protein